MKIVTVQNSEITLEQMKVNQITIDVNNKDITLQGNNTITRADGVEVVNYQMAGMTIQPSGSSMPSNPALSSAQVATIMQAEEAFLQVIQNVLESVAKTV